MAKYLVGYCSECGKETKQRKLECEDSVPWRIIETVVTLGWGLILDRDYKCECTRCGEINTITRQKEILYGRICRRFTCSNESSD